MAKSIGVQLAFIIPALFLTPIIAKATSLKGNWDWSEHIIPGESTIQRLEFLDNHRVAGFLYLPHVFSKIGPGGEALESDSYRYKISKNTIIFSSKNGFGSGWPNWHGVEGKTQKCGFSFGATKNYFVLSNCDLAGNWHLMPQE
jgi:hypothetical protein